MDGLCRCLAVGVPLPLPAGGGRPPGTYLLQPTTLSVIAALEAGLLARRGDPLSRVIDGLVAHPDVPQEVGDMLVARARDELRRDRSLRLVPVKDLHAYLYTWPGIAETAWHGLRDSGHPAFATLEGARDFVYERGSEFALEFVRVRDLASGCDHLAALDWPDEDGAAKGDKVRYIPWRRILRHFLEFGLGPREVGGMTLYMLKTYTCDLDQLGGTRQVEGTREAMTFSQQRRLARQVAQG